MSKTNKTFGLPGLPSYDDNETKKKLPEVERSSNANTWSRPTGNYVCMLAFKCLLNIQID